MSREKCAFGAALLAAAVAMLALGASAASDVARDGGGVSARSAIDFAIQVPRVMRMRLQGHPAALDITADDIARGSVKVTGASLDLLVNDRLGYLIHADLAGGAFSAVKIVGLSSPVVATQAGASIRMDSMVGKPKPAPMAVEYELRLSPDAQPGHYAWPVTLSLQQL
jgi:hypothetical protein